MRKTMEFDDKSITMSDSQIIRCSKNTNECKRSNVSSDTYEILDLFNSKFYCKICRQKLRTKADEIIHLKYKHNREHDSDVPIKCLFCVKQFKTYFSFKKHLIIKHLDERPYGCNLCVRKRFTNFCHLKTHIKRSHKTCELAMSQLISYTNSKFEIKKTKIKEIIPKREQTTEEDKEKRHMVLKIKNEVVVASDVYQINMKLNCFKCKLCSKICLTEANYLVHVWEHLINSSKSYLMCWHCKTQKFNSYYDLEMHLHTKHLNELTYECNECKQGFYDWNLLRLHLNKTHFNAKTITFKCLHCDVLFDEHKDVVFHTLKVHCSAYLNNDNNLYKCSLCDDKLKSKLMFNLHLEQHEFVSSINKSSKSNGSMLVDNNSLPSTSTTNVKIASAGRRVISLICDLCGYTFENTFFLNQHKSLHLSENLKRPHKCHLCQVTFSKSEQLMRHMIVHSSNELDYVCKVCFSTFSRKQDLDRHMHFHIK